MDNICFYGREFLYLFLRSQYLFRSPLLLFTTDDCVLLTVRPELVRTVQSWSFHVPAFENVPVNGVRY